MPTSYTTSWGTTPPLIATCEKPNKTGRFSSHRIRTVENRGGDPDGDPRAGQVATIAAPGEGRILGRQASFLTAESLKPASAIRRDGGMCRPPAKAGRGRFRGTGSPGCRGSDRDSALRSLCGGNRDRIGFHGRSSVRVVADRVSVSFLGSQRQDCLVRLVGSPLWASHAAPGRGCYPG
jgi:hypothetical protein